MELKLLLEYTKDLTVLYVEDDIDLLNTTKELFDNYFVVVDIASDGQLGLDKYIEYHKANDDFYDIVISDINMPKLDGIGMSKAIYVINSSQEIIIVSAYDEVEYLSSDSDVSIDSYITKPINNEQLTNVIYAVSQRICSKKILD